MFVDFAYGRPGGPVLRNAGITAVMRYLCQNDEKRMDRAEIDDYRAHGIAVHAVYQNGTRDGFGGYTAGINNAQQARQQALQMGWDGNGAIYYVPVDADVSPSDLPILREYGRGFAAVFGPQHCGVYGETSLLSSFYETGLVKYRWQSASASFSDYTLATCNLRQLVQQITVAGVAMDVNAVLNPDTGAWFTGGTMSATGPEKWDTADWKAFDGHVWGARPPVLDQGSNHPVTIQQGRMDAVMGKAYVYAGSNLSTLVELSRTLDEIIREVAALVPGAFGTMSGTVDVTLSPRDPQT